MNDAAALDTAVRAAWRDFQTQYEPLRPTLCRFCRHLIRSPWDAEDLVQDALARAFEDGGEGTGIDPRFAQGVLPRPARAEIPEFRGEPVLVSWYQHRDGEAVRAVTRVEIDPDSGRISRMWNYFFTPEVLVEVSGELELPHRTNGTYRSREAISCAPGAPVDLERRGG
jgi:hypothetical protein